MTTLTLVGTPDPDPRPKILDPDDATHTFHTVVEGQAVAAGHDIAAVDAVALADDSDPADVARPVVADWASEPATIREAMADFAARQWQAARFHAARSPIYAGRLVATSPYGLARASTAAVHWAQDRPGLASVAAVQAGTASGNLESLGAAHRSAVRSRSAALTALTAITPAVAVFLWLTRPVWLVAALGAAVAVFGVYGRPARKTPIVERATYKAASFPPFTEDLMVQGLREVLGTKQGKRDITVIQPPARTRTGWEAIVIVPGDAATVAEKRRVFAGEIGRPVGCVWLTTGEGDDTDDHPAGWLKIVVTRKSMKRVRVPDWPWLDAGPTDYFSDEIPIGVNALGDPVTAATAYQSMVGGGIMGSGKSESLKVQVLGEVSDDRVELDIFDMKGGRDWLPFAPFAHTYISGSDVDDHQRILARLEEINVRLERRAETLRNLPDSIAAVKTNTVLADRRDLDLWPIVIVVDETQELFEFSADADRYLFLINRLLKKGRAYAITVKLVTQEISKKTLPMASLCHWRHVHQTGPGFAQTDQVLGDGTYRSGVHADKLDAPGLGFFGSAGNYQLVRSYWIPGPGETVEDQLTPLCERLAERRRARGLLTGMAAGQVDPDTDLEGEFDRVVRVWAGDPARIQVVDLLARLHTDRPTEYPAPDATGAEIDQAIRALTGRMRRHHVDTTSVRVGGRNGTVRQGFRWDDVTGALETRATRPEGDIHIPTDGDTNTPTGGDTDA